MTPLDNNQRWKLLVEIIVGIFTIVGVIYGIHQNLLWLFCTLIIVLFIVAIFALHQNLLWLFCSCIVALSIVAFFTLRQDILWLYWIIILAGFVLTFLYARKEQIWKSILSSLWLAPFFMMAFLLGIGVSIGATHEIPPPSPMPETPTATTIPAVTIMTPVLTLTPTPTILVTELENLYKEILASTELEIQKEYRGSACRSDPCIRIAWVPITKTYVSLYWRYPVGNWGNWQGHNLTGATRITFWARGERGNESIEFRTGCFPPEEPGQPAKPYKDSFCAPGKNKPLVIPLSTYWQKYQISLTTLEEGETLENVISAFSLVIWKEDNPKGVTFYLDDILIEGIAEPKW